ncbi:plasmid recombination protein [Pseudomonas arsenicoxydans]|uniref:plasmid recombination protein n=1 Tax=Pseudomonas arsenicoxydans TaxID=702115 RepID=UPI001ABF8A0A|nr:plasmid recombination protein [Pseudomonas arsenicoxydans]
MYQFVHIESYSRVTPKTGKQGGHSVSSIINEAIRREGSIPHISSPSAPIFLYGGSLESIEEKCNEWAASISDLRGHKTRRDALCLLAGVVSAESVISSEAWQKLKADTLAWLQEKYGGRLQAVIEHTDEAHPHLHFYCVPLHGERFEQLHDGKRAAAALKAKRKSEQNVAYKHAMRAFQDEFSDKVGIPNGMARFGPRKRRLSRDSWKQEQAQVIAISKALRGSEELRLATIDQATTMIDEVTREVSEIKRIAIESGEARGLDNFIQKNFAGKLVELIFGVSRQNKKLVRRLRNAEESLARWKSKAVRYEEKGRELLGRLMFIKPRYRDLEAEFSRMARLKTTLEETKRKLEQSEQQLDRTEGALGIRDATIEMYRRRESERETIALDYKKMHQKVHSNETSHEPVI